MIVLAILAALRTLVAQNTEESTSKNALYIHPILPAIGILGDFPTMFFVTYEREFGGDKSFNFEPVFVTGDVEGDSYDFYTEPNIKTSGFGAGLSLKKYLFGTTAEGIFIGPKISFTTVDYTMPAYVRGQPLFNIQVAEKSATETNFAAVMMLGYRAKWAYFNFYLGIGAGVGKTTISGNRDVFDQVYLDESKDALRIDGDFGIGFPF